jgi:hypothetical protein
MIYLLDKMNLYPHVEKQTTGHGQVEFAPAEQA